VGATLFVEGQCGTTLPLKIHESGRERSEPSLTATHYRPKWICSVQKEQKAPLLFSTILTLL